MFVPELFSRSEEAMSHVGLGFLGQMWVVLPLCILFLLWIPQQPILVLAFLILIWMSDTAAYVFGSLFGVGVPAVLALVVALTALCLRFFVAYAKERDDFVAATAHDLATPLVAMRRLIGRDDAEAKNLADRMVRIVENLSEFLELGGRRQQAAVRVVCGNAYREAYALFRDDFRFHFGGRDVEVSGLENLAAAADRTCTVQMLWNLLANELKYAAPHGRVSVRFEADGDRAKVVFADEGPGLSRRERRRIFRRYYRAKSLMKCGKGGFGIGLCTAREGARAMGGDLTVAANAPHGCVFTLELRRAT